jgi:hypothetical protein
MKKFSVLLTRDTTQYCYVTVEAEDEDAAEDAALKCDESLHTMCWGDNDSPGAPYIADPGGCAEELDEDETIT